MEKPFISSKVSFEISNGPQFDRGKRGYDLERRNFAVQRFARVKGERRLRLSNLLVSVSKLNLTVLVSYDRPIFSSNNRIRNYTVVPRRNDDHWCRV